MFRKKLWIRVFAVLLFFSLFTVTSDAKSEEKNTIKWVDFNVTKNALTDAMNVDISTYKSGLHHSWIDLLAVLAVHYGGEFKHYKKADLDDVVAAVEGGNDYADVSKNEKLFLYYKKAYKAVLGGMLGEYTEICGTTTSEGYGLIAYSPIAKGYSYSHYDDFGASRSYGYRRQHLGHDLMGSVGTPVIAVEAGYVEACGWNQYGGWRIGIRSFDGKRYYYYAHLRKNHPYANVYEGKIVDAGEVIGYLGMTGYSTKENTNNINVPHLHYGLQLIFDPAQKDGWNQIWIDLFAMTDFLGQNRSTVQKAENGEYYATSVRTPKNAPD